MRHKHADLIHAWAEGAVIQYRFSPEDDWGDITCPSFRHEGEYRIKPTPRPDVVRWACINESYGASSPSDIVGDPDIKLTFDGETGKLKSAEVL